VALARKATIPGRIKPVTRQALPTWALPALALLPRLTVSKSVCDRHAQKALGRHVTRSCLNVADGLWAVTHRLAGRSLHELVLDRVGCLLSVPALQRSGIDRSPILSVTERQLPHVPVHVRQALQFAFQHAPRSADLLPVQVAVVQHPRSVVVLLRRSAAAPSGVYSRWTCVELIDELSVENEIERFTCCAPVIEWSVSLPLSARPGGVTRG
jgi:hypothetical protein